MSLLRNVLKKNTASTDTQPPPDGLSDKSRASLLTLARRSMSGADKPYAASVKSSAGMTVYSVRSIAESMTSFASALVGGKRVPKRRRPDISRLGVPKWYDKHPPPAPEMPSTEKVDVASLGYVSAHAYSRRKDRLKVGQKAYITVVLYSYALENAERARYYDGSRIRGEIRICLEEPDPISSIDVWCQATAESNFATLDGHHVNYHVNIWDRKNKASTNLEVGKTHIFPFELEPLPADVKVNRPDSMAVARVPLPPSYKFSRVGSFSGEIKYFVAVDIKRDGFRTINDEWNIPIHYYPLRRPTVRSPTLFPFIPDREDWPYSREEIGGWTVTPFGGRGRFRGEIVEIEGLLGVQTPEVYTATQTLRYSLLLWSKSLPALSALSDPKEADIDVVFCSHELFGTDVLHPRNAARRNRITKRLAQGRVWQTEEGPPEGDEMPPLREELRMVNRTAQGVGGGEGEGSGGDAKAGEKEASGGAGSGSVPPPTSPVSEKPSVRSRFQHVVTMNDDGEEDEEDEESKVDLFAEGEKQEGDDAEVEEARPPSPGSDEGVDLDEPEHLEGTVRLDGDLCLPRGMLPSFRYKWMGREYGLHVTFMHPEYSHISPSAVSIYAETPIWTVLGKPADTGETEEKNANAGTKMQSGEQDLSQLPMNGQSIPVPDDAVRAEAARGGPTQKQRQTRRGQRYGGT